MTRRSVGMFCFERYDSRFRFRRRLSSRRCYRRRTARLIDARVGVVIRARGIGVVKSFASPAVRLVGRVCVFCFVSRRVCSSGAHASW